MISETLAALVFSGLAVSVGTLMLHEVLRELRYYLQQRETPYWAILNEGWRSKY